MASLTIRRLDEGVKAKLRLRAARHGRSMEQEAREILRHALAQGKEPGKNLAEAIRKHIEPVGGVDLPMLSREPVRQPPALER